MRNCLLGIVLIPVLSSGVAYATDAELLAESAPGIQEIAEQQNYTGTITAINAKTRMVTIAGDAGRVMDIKAGPEVKRFAELKVGDRVTFSVTEALALELRKGSTAAVARTDETVAEVAGPDQAPGGVVEQTTRIMAEVIAVDREKSTITLKGPVHSLELKVKDPAQLKEISVGDRIEAVYIESRAITVTPASAKN
jgi:Cu/Ag efflux protein CusF